MISVQTLPLLGCLMIMAFFGHLGALKAPEPAPKGIQCLKCADLDMGGSCSPSLNATATPKCEGEFCSTLEMDNGAGKKLYVRGCGYMQLSDPATTGLTRVIFTTCKTDLCNQETADLCGGKNGETNPAAPAATNGPVAETANAEVAVEKQREQQPAEVEKQPERQPDVVKQGKQNEQKQEETEVKEQAKEQPKEEEKVVKQEEQQKKQKHVKPSAPKNSGGRKKGLRAWGRRRWHGKGGRNLKKVEKPGRKPTGLKGRRRNGNKTKV